MARQALGRGLEALIPTRDTGEAVVEIEIQNITTNPQQPRKIFTRDAMEGLVSSIKRHGIIQPIIVRKKGDEYELIAGERRLLAAENSGMKKVPAIVKTASDEKSLEIALIENIQREDLNPMEEARAFARLINEFGLSQEDVAEQVAKNRSTVTNTLRLLKLPEQIQHWLEEGILSTGHAKAILSLITAPLQMKVAEEIVQKGLSVREAEEKAKRIKEKNSVKKVEITLKKDPYILGIEEKMKDYFSTMVRIKDKSKKGKILIEYYSWEELQRIVELLKLELI